MKKIAAIIAAVIIIAVIIMVLGRLKPTEKFEGEEKILENKTIEVESEEEIYQELESELEQNITDEELESMLGEI